MAVALELRLPERTRWRYRAKYIMMPTGPRRFVLRAASPAAGEAADRLGRRVYQVSRRLRGDRELARYMGFPDWYRLGNPSWSRLVQVLGNSVIPPMIAALARQAKAALEAADFRRLVPRLVMRPVVQLALPC